MFRSGLLLLAAAAGIRVAHADFMVYTQPPIPTDAVPSFANTADVIHSLPHAWPPLTSSQAAQWTTSVGIAARFAYANFVESLGPEYESSKSSVASEVKAFFETAKNYTVSSTVTMDGPTQTFLTKPDWYTALPSGVRAFKEQQVSDQFSIVRSVIGGEQQGTTASSTAAASAPTPGGLLDAKFGALAAVAAAAFL
jgi:hypothetical protein